MDTVRILKAETTPVSPSLSKCTCRSSTFTQSP